MTKEGLKMDVNSISRTSTYATESAYAQQQTKAAEDSTEKKEEESGVVYEKSDADRSAIIARLKADAEERTAQMRSMVESMMRNQGVQIGNADSMWRFLASGNFTVSAAAKAKAQEAISEDGYWGVKQTSERILEFAKALTGGDASKADEMRKAFEKGFKQATGAWGKELPSISQQTYDAVMKGFDEWEGSVEEAEQEA